MKRYKHNLSHYKLLTCDMGQLVPVSCFEVLPGDSIQQACSALIRVSPLNAPVMHPVSVRMHHFFVPHRLVWDGWEDFITGGPDGEGGDAGTYPTITAGGGGFAEGSLCDYFGVPTGVASISISALPIRSFNLIFNEFYRDADLVTELAVPTASGADTTSPITVPNIAWEKDRFTSARPWPQKGPEVTLPLGTSAPVKGIAPSASFAYDQTNTAVRESAGSHSWSAVTYGSSGFVDGAAGRGLNVRQNADFPGGPDIYADLSLATSVDINTVREAFAIQRYQEARARYGSRYTEYLRYLGVRSSDARLQRPEYLGGGKQTISFTEVLQTAGDVEEGSSVPEGVGTLRGHGITAMRSRRYRRFFEEHGVVITLLSVRPRTMYAQGLHKMWSRRIKEEYWQKELEHIGQEEVYRRELYVEGDATDDEVFGYQDRYDDYRHAVSQVAGEFRSTLNYWHLARLFGSNPTLNGSFVTCDPSKRIHQVQSENVLWIMANQSVQARRMVTANAGGRIL